MAAKLLYRDAQGRDAAVNLPETGSFLGRAVDCIIRTDDAMVSRKNCKISFINARWYVEDLGSANGTFINERRISRDELNHGDVIRCGSLQVRFVDAPEQQVRQTIPQPGAPTPATPPTPPAPPSGNPAAQPSPPAATPPSPPPIPGAANQAAQSNKPEPAADAEKSSESKPVEGAKISVSEEAVKKVQDEVNKLTTELAAAQKSLDEIKTEKDQAVTKIETMEGEVKKLRQEAAAAKTTAEKLSRQMQQTEKELREESRNNEELRQDLKQLKEQFDKTKAQADELKTQSEAKDRELAAAKEDVRRSKQAADNLTQKLQEMARSRDEQMRAINSQIGDVDKLRDILKERERLIEEQRVGLVNQESQLKDLRKRSEEQERELSSIRGERDNLRERQNRAQVQVEELRSELDRLHNMLSNQVEGGEQIANLTRDMAALRENLADANNDVERLNDQLTKVSGDLAAVIKQRDQLAEERKGSQAKIQSAVEQAVNQAVTELRAKAEKEKQEIIDKHNAKAQEVAELKNRLASATPSESVTQELSSTKSERDQYRARVAELEAMCKELQKAAAHPAPAASQGNSDAERVLAEMKGVATTAYDGINDALSELRLAIVMAQEMWNKMERSYADRDAGRKLRDAIDDTMNRADEAKGHVRSLRSLIE